MGFIYDLMRKLYKLRRYDSHKKILIVRGELFKLASSSLDLLFGEHKNLRDAFSKKNSLFYDTALTLFSKYLNEFFFFKIAPNKVIEVPKIGKSHSFRSFKREYAVVGTVAGLGNLPIKSAATKGWDLVKCRLFSYLFIEKYFVTPYALIRISARIGRYIETYELQTAFFIALNHFDYSVAKSTIKWVNYNNAEDALRFVISADKPVPSLLVAKEKIVLVHRYNKHNTKGLKILADYIASKKARLVNLQNNNLPLVSFPWIEKLADIRKPLVLVKKKIFVPFNDLYNKGRNPRNKQIYRTGVFLCLWLTVITVVGPFYIFYAFNFVYTYLWIFLFLLVARLCYALFMRFYEVRRHSIPWIIRFFL